MNIEYQDNQPCFKGIPLSKIVHICHEKSLDKALEIFSTDGLERSHLDSLLTYCAQLSCIEDKVTCPGCKKRSEVEGLVTIEDFISCHEKIVIGDGDVILLGKGKGIQYAPNLASLEKTWAGENYWFWARRCLRRLRHGLRRAFIHKNSNHLSQNAPSIILVEPQLPDNIGMVARACANFGLQDLRLVKPRDGWPNEKARIAASGASFILDETKSYETLFKAVGDLQWICATTARQRDLRKPIMTSEQAAEEMRRRISAGQRCGVLFGRERSGLTTEEVAFSDAVVMIPVDNNFASLNIAQAVLILGYDWLRGSPSQSLGRVTTYESPIAPGFNFGNQIPATKEQIIGFFEHLEAELDKMGFFSSPQKRPTVVNNLRSLFLRADPTDQEIRTLRGIVATLVHGKGSARKTSF